MNTETTVLNVARQLAPDWSEKPLESAEAAKFEKQTTSLWRWNLACAIAHGVQAVAALGLGASLDFRMRARARSGRTLLRSLRGFDPVTWLSFTRDARTFRPAPLPAAPQASPAAMRASSGCRYRPRSWTGAVATQCSRCRLAGSCPSPLPRPASRGCRASRTQSSCCALHGTRPTCGAASTASDGSSTPSPARS